MDLIKREIDEIICKWSLKFNVAMSTEALDFLVDRLDELATKCMEE